MLKTGTRKDLEAYLPKMPSGWRVWFYNHKYEFVLAVGEHRKFFVLPRLTKPVGWVAFEGAPHPVFIKGAWVVAIKRKKLLPMSFPDPTSAAIAIHLKEEV